MSELNGIVGYQWVWENGRTGWFGTTCLVASVWTRTPPSLGLPKSSPVLHTGIVIDRIRFSETC